MPAPIDVPVLENAILPQSVMTRPHDPDRRLLLVLQHDRLGQVDLPQGTVLLAGLVSQFIALESLPAAIILQGTAVRLADRDNPVAQQLSQLIALHVPVLVCRESLMALGLENHLTGARMATQREIAEQLIKTRHIIWL